VRLIPDQDLRADLVPTIRSPWVQISRFGHSFDGYAAFGDDCARLANEGAPVSLRELRAVLFFELRRWRHFGYEPDAEAMQKFDWLLESIRNKVRERA
jgi:hypothetical protein